MVVLHGLAQSRSLRIVWLLELLSIPYELRQHNRNPETLLAPATLKEIHPLGKAPILEDNGFILNESGAITEYLISRYGNGHIFTPSTDSLDYWLTQSWIHYAEGSLMPLILMSLVFRKIETSPMPLIARPIAKKIVGRAKQGFIHPQLHLHLAHVNRQLAGKTWLMGDHITAADIMMSFPLQAAKVRFDIDVYPFIVAYLNRISENPAYQRAVEKAGQPVFTKV